MIYRIADQIYIPYFTLDIKRKGIRGTVNLTRHSETVKLYNIASIAYNFKPEDLVSSQYYIDPLGSMWFVCYAFINDTVFNLMFCRH